ncbi:hypothetical protein DPSP01_012705 [Paraphaeosphaeria sporulosa]|uniref:Uncharacterized protein n=1 Tax=Paraphaeosphaeria sporulosa TaxID=1460663 RepID=A0A177C8U5_9PLEO|nr:uncharacterized protein CC84DRAFT_1220089 [Paraphaeosphaeria sporulosa]OAG03198.1 hypothetical protein CC84DRAFT_1220089 [Paraphaeosphaeria sporulosa]
MKQMWGRNPTEWDWGIHLHDDQWSEYDDRPIAVGHDWKRGLPWDYKGSHQECDVSGWDDWEHGGWDDGDWGDGDWNDQLHHHWHHHHCGGRLPDYYRDIIELSDEFHPPLGFEVPVSSAPAMPISTPITACPRAATRTPEIDISWMSGNGK